jgi:hypothetical protein
MKPSNLRLDAGESVFFNRQLEAIDKTVYETVYPENKARSLIPTQQGIPDWAKVYTWRLFSKFGQAKIAANMADDIPRADVAGEEASKVIKPVVASYGYDLFEIKAAAATGTPLDALKAQAARFAIESEIDSILALGDAVNNLQGLLAIAAGTTALTLGTKAAGGLTWAVATPDEIVADITSAPTAIRGAMSGAGGPVFSNFTILIPDAQYGQIAQTRMGDGSDTTILKFVLATSPFISDIQPWHHCHLASGGGTTDRMVCYPKNPLVVAGIVPMEFTSQPPEQRNLEYVINCMSTTGGIVVRYPLAIAYGDGL